MIQDECLQHHGVPHQKWGVKHGPPYPLPRGAFSGRAKSVDQSKKAKSSGEKVLRSGDSKGPIHAIKRAKKTRKLRKENEERIARLESEEAKTRERERVLREGRASEILQNKNYYTTKQLQNAADRIKWENTLADYASKEKSEGFKKVDKIMTNVGTINDWISTGVNSKKNIDALIRIFGEASKKAEQEQNNKKKKKKKSYNINEGDSLD